MSGSETAPEDEVRHLLSVYGSPQASAADLLCDRHPPGAIAYRVVAPDLSWTALNFDELRSESSRLAAGFWSLGVRPGDRIATLMGKSRWYLATVMAIWRLGAVHVPLFTAFAPAPVAFRLAASGCKLVVCDPAQRGKLVSSAMRPEDCAWRIVTAGTSDGETLTLKELRDGNPADFGSARLGGDAPLIHIYTSGTTGYPRGVIVPLRAVASFHAYATYGLGLLPDDVFWNAADPGWAYGLYLGVVASLATGVSSVLLQGGFSAQVTLGVLSSLAVTNFAAAPTVFRALRASGLRAPGRIVLRCASSAGEPLTHEVSDWSQAVLGVPVHDHYGQTELGMIINNHHHPRLRLPLRSGSIGRAMPGWKADVLAMDSDGPAPVGSMGRLAVDSTQSPLAWFKGYADDPAHSATKICGGGRWRLTGDCAKVDEEGYFHFAAREDDVIIMAGYRIGPAEIESVLLSHPAVCECAVVAAPDEIRGEVLEAFVVLQDGYEAGEHLTREIQEWVKSRYAAHAYPRRIHYAHELPKTPSGKVQRFVLRQTLRQDRADASDVREDVK